MQVEDYHDFFVASGGVAGALIGLLFVAISVSRERLAERGGGPVHRVRAVAALTTFTNALVVSLFGLIPHEGLGNVAVTISVVGLFSVTGMLISLFRTRAVHLRSLLDVAFVIGMAVVFGFQLWCGLRLEDGPSRASLQTLATLVIVCFLIGIARSWELIGGPSIGFRGEAGRLARDVVTRNQEDRT